MVWITERGNIIPPAMNLYYLTKDPLADLKVGIPIAETNQ